MIETKDKKEKKKKSEEGGNRIGEKGGAVRMRVKMDDQGGVKRLSMDTNMIRGRVGSLQDTC